MAEPHREAQPLIVPPLKRELGVIPALIVGTQAVGDGESVTDEVQDPPPTPPPSPAAVLDTVEVGDSLEERVCPVKSDGEWAPLMV